MVVIVVARELEIAIGVICFPTSPTAPPCTFVIFVTRFSETFKYFGDRDLN